MPGFNWREIQGHVRAPNQAIGGGAVAAEGSNWRTQLPPGSRHELVNKLLDVLKNHRPISGEEGLEDLEESAVRFEESIFTTATSQLDYLRRISLKMIGIEMEYQNLGVNSLQTNAAGVTRNSDPVSSETLSDQMDIHEQCLLITVQAPEMIPSSEVDAGVGSDWRIQLQSDSRNRIVNKIVETLRRVLRVSGPEGEREVKAIAVRFEERIYSSATSQSDYLRKISLKMLTMETRSEPAVVSSLHLTATSDGGNPQNADDYLAG